MKKKYLAVVFFATVLGACGMDQTPPKRPIETESPPPPSPVEVAADSAVPASDTPSPQGIQTEAYWSNFSQKLAADGRGRPRFNRVRPAKDGDSERQVYVEMALTDQEAADAAERVLLDLGHKAGRRWGDENGVRMRFMSSTEVPISVLVRSREAHAGLKYEDSASSVYVTLPAAE